MAFCAPSMLAQKQRLSRIDVDQKRSFRGASAGIVKRQQSSKLSIMAAVIQKFVAMVADKGSQF